MVHGRLDDPVAAIRHEPFGDAARSEHPIAGWIAAAWFEARIAGIAWRRRRPRRRSLLAATLARSELPADAIAIGGGSRGAGTRLILRAFGVRLRGGGVVVAACRDKEQDE